MVSKMVRSKKEFRCNECSAKFIKWSGICFNCGKGGSLEEFVLIPAQKKPVATRTQKSILRRSKNSERTVGKRFVALDGPDPAFQHIATSTGRIGHITNIRADTVSRFHLVENKNRTLPLWMINAWILILQRADDFDKIPVFHLDPPNLPKEYPHNGVKKKVDTMAVIPQNRYEELVKMEREYQELKRNG